MKKILFILITALTFAACSSDDPYTEDPNGGGGNGSGNGGNNGSGTNTGNRKPIPAAELTGKWVFDKSNYEIVADNAEAYKGIEKDLLYGTSYDLYPKVGMMKFEPGKPTLGIKGMNAEGGINWNYEDKTDKLEKFADYYTNGDTVFYYHWTLKKKYHYMLKKNDRLYYHFENTGRFLDKFPNGGVKKVIYYAEYVRAKE